MDAQGISLRQNPGDASGQDHGVGAALRSDDDGCQLLDPNSSHVRNVAARDDEYVPQTAGGSHRITTEASSS